MKKFTKDELKKHDGVGENQVLVAADGKIWNLSGSKMWKEGKHMNSHHAGVDLSLALEAAPHGADVLDRFDLVGELADDPSSQRKHKEFPEPSALVKKILDQHPHPISAHFPIGLGIASAVFAVLFGVFEIAGMDLAAFYNLVFAAMTTPLCIAAGVFSWYYNYGATWTNIFKMKATLSLLLLFMLGLAIAFKLSQMMIQEPSETFKWAYVGLSLLIAPTVSAIGRLGGKITFPS